MSLRRLLLFSLFLALPAAASEQTKIVNGGLEYGFPSVGRLLNSGDCTATLIGCRTVLTAAHCVCTGDNGELPPEACAAAGLLNPARHAVFFPHAGLFAVSSVTVHPERRLISTGQPAHDLAILKLASPVTGVQPSMINQLGPVGNGVGGVVVGFGRTATNTFDDSSGIKRSGLVLTASCDAPGHLCWDFTGASSSTCQGDSGGPLFVASNGISYLAGVTSFGDVNCQAPSTPHDADVYLDRAWIAAQVGADLASGPTQCGAIRNVQPEGVIGATYEFTSTLEYEPVAVPAGVARLRISTSGIRPLVTGVVTPTGNTACAGAGDYVNFCEFANPTPGNYLVKIATAPGTDNIAQTVWSILGADAPPTTPPPPAGPWLQTSQLPGYQFKVRINGSAAGTQVADCVPETLCVAGAIPTRAELFLRIIGPRPNGFLWAQAVRFTTSRLEVWVQRLSTGETNYYDMPAVPQDSAELPGLVDKEAFQP